MTSSSSARQAEREPSIEEQHAVEDYVLRRPLVRPRITYARASLNVVFFLAANILFIILFERFIRRFLFPIRSFSFLENAFRLHPSLSIVILTLFILLSSSLLVFKSAIIGLIHLYQHYAPERIRRKCLFQPTCSEYAILSLKKYGVIRGGCRAYSRYRRCKGHVYKIDNP